MRKKNILCLLSIVFLLLLCGVLLPGPSSDIFASGPRDEYQKIQKDIRKQKKKLAQATRIEKSVVSDLRKVESQIYDIGEQVAATKKQINTIRGNIAALEGKIDTGSGNLEAQRKNLGKRLRTLQRINDSKELMLMLISNEDPSTILRVSRSLAEISRRYNESITNYRTELIGLGAQKKKLDALVSNLRSEEQNLTRLEDSLKTKKKDKETLLASVRKEKDTYLRMINELKDNSDRTQRIIRESEKREKAPKRKTLKGKQSEPVGLPADNEFTRIKGKLTWPVQGKVAIRYGSQIDPIFNLPVFRSGIHIKSEAGSVVSAVWQGKVVYAAEFKGYGKMVVISHGAGYHTLYGNLSKIFLKNEAIIKENDQVGEVGDSTAIASSGLYFEIRYKGKPLDPQQWLKKSGG
jgi:septal ring factor EnvC (AmiA/AmiB activator)